MENKKHLPIMGVGPIYVAVIITITVIAVIAGKSMAFQTGMVAFLKNRQPYCRKQVGSHWRLCTGEESDLLGFYLLLHRCTYDRRKCIFSAIVLFLLDIYVCAYEMHGRKVTEKSVWQGICEILQASEPLYPLTARKWEVICI